MWLSCEMIVKRWSIFVKLFIFISNYLSLEFEFIKFGCSKYFCGVYFFLITFLLNLDWLNLDVHHLCLKNFEYDLFVMLFCKNCLHWSARDLNCNLFFKNSYEYKCRH